MAGLFDTFTISKRGLSAQQSNINTNAHNIANANTTGYSRQRAVAETTRPFGGLSRFDSCSVGQVGTGVQITSIMRIRDTFIDYQLRNEYGKLGNYEVQSDFLSQVEDVFGEPSTNGIQNLFSEFYDAFQEVAKTPEKSAARTVAIQKADSLANALNKAYIDLEKKLNNAENLLQQNVVDVNSYLNQINELNQEINRVAAIGMTPNDLMDKRDNLLDELSHMFGITVERDKRETINLKFDGFPAIDSNGNEKIKINNLVNSDPSNENYTRFSYIKEVNIDKNNPKKIIVEYYPLGDYSAIPQTLEVEADSKQDAENLKKSLEQNRILLGNKDGIVADASGTTKVVDKNGNITITDKNGCITVKDSNGSIIEITNNKGYEVTPNGPNPEDVKITDENGNVITPQSDIRITGDYLNQLTFKIYQYDNEVNNVDNKNIKGEIAGNQSVQDMIKGYMTELDKVAKCLAYSVNAIQIGSINGTPSNPKLSTSEYLVFVNSEKVIDKDGNSDDINDDYEISAKNITVNKELINDVFKLNCKDNTDSAEKNGERAQAIASLISVKMDISNINIDSLDSREKFFNLNTELKFDGVNITGNSSGKTMDSYYKDMISQLGTKAQEANRLVIKQRENTIQSLEQQKLSVSGVSLDEEMSDLIQFQHAYQANAKMISTIDELLDVVINQLKR